MRASNQLRGAEVRIVREWKKVTLTGGGVKDKGLSAVIEELLDTDILIAEKPPLMKALGAALFAGDASVS